MQGCHLSCSLYGCRRTYTKPEALASHLQDHHRIPAQSLPGKSFLCSTIGCEASFSSMQQLMDHMRHHHKPNYFFLCESCRAKLRSYRTLLKHLQTCAKVAKKAARSEPGVGPDMGPSGVPMDMEHTGPLQVPGQPEQMQMQAVPTLISNSGALVLPNQHIQQPPPNQHVQQPSVNGASLDPASARPLAETMAVLEPNPPQGVSVQPEASYSQFPPSLSPMPPPTLPDLPQLEQQNQWSPRMGQPVPPSSPPGSNAVWRKNQDPPVPILHRWNSPPCQAQALSREEVQVSPSAAEFYGSTPGGATAVFSVATAPPTARR